MTDDFLEEDALQHRVGQYARRVEAQRSCQGFHDVFNVKDLHPSFNQFLERSMNAVATGCANGPEKRSMFMVAVYTFSDLIGKMAVEGDDPCLGVPCIGMCKQDLCSQPSFACSWGAFQDKWGVLRCGFDDEFLLVTETSDGLRTKYCKSVDLGNDGVSPTGVDFRLNEV